MIKLKHLSIFCINFVLLIQNPAWAQDTLSRSVKASLQEGAKAWNDGDLDAFMKGYVEGQDLTYTAGGRIVRGSKALFERYQSTYGQNKTSMGQLRFEEIETWPLGPDHALAMGKWILDFPGAIKAPVDGIFSLVLRKGPDGWLILHDHTSRREEEKKP